MPSIPLIALKPHPYAGRRLVPGQSFTTQSRDHARLLKAIGVAKDAPSEAEPSQVVASEPEPSTIADDSTHVFSGVVEAPAERPKRQYRRRDLSAETE